MSRRSLAVAFLLGAACLPPDAARCQGVGSSASGIQTRLVVIEPDHQEPLSAFADMFTQALRKALPKTLQLCLAHATASSRRECRDVRAQAGLAAAGFGDKGGRR